MQVWQGLQKPQRPTNPPSQYCVWSELNSISAQVRSLVRRRRILVRSQPILLGTSPLLNSSLPRQGVLLRHYLAR
ncbi:hypothetical protein DPMN_033896 [Dreissena polymorpha]|uniref:Uncharacterized protein n=1 Tax=Dreissena polymorpha TaxID=45954 RepID=A0A9D4RLK1_DREPO|nr:hypothetical protein DPMN_033896 [Dreissena polymorpha]